MLAISTFCERAHVEMIISGKFGTMLLYLRFVMYLTLTIAYVHSPTRGLTFYWMPFEA